MVLPRPAAFRAALNQYATRRLGAQARSRVWQQIGRRTYASGHGAEKSSDLPWIIGSAVVTIPAASWLLSQGPSGGGGHGHGEAHESHEEPEEQPEEESEDKDEEASDDSGSEGGDGSSETPATSDNESEEDGPSPGSPGQINESSNKGPGEQQKQDEPRGKTETQAEKTAASHYSGAKHPYLDDPEKSKKGEGLTETAKIHGTVDSNRDVR